MRSASRFLCVIGGLLGVAGCVDHLQSPTFGKVTTLELSLLAPSPGTPQVPNVSRDAMVTLVAKDEDGAPYGGDANIDIYVSYEGVRSGVTVQCGDNNDAPIESLAVRGGTIANHKLTLPEAYGSTSIWAVERDSHVIGASDPIYYPNPTIPNLQTPTDVNAPEATYCTRFDKKFITVDHPTGAGELLVESVFGNAITVTDTGQSDFRSIYLFVFSAPDSRLVPGTHIKSFNGNISKFVGFTEVNFPVIHADFTVPAEPNKLPVPIPLTITDRQNNTPKLNAANSAVVQVSGSICPTLQPNPNHDPTIQSTIDSWVKYNTFSIGDPKIGCDSFTTYSVQLPTKIVNGFDPTMLVGKPVTIRGMLKNSSGQNPILVNGKTVPCDAVNTCAGGTCSLGICKKGAFNFWTVAVRDKNDITQ